MNFNTGLGNPGGIGKGEIPRIIQRHFGHCRKFSSVFLVQLQRIIIDCHSSSSIS